MVLEAHALLALRPSLPSLKVASPSSVVTSVSPNRSRRISRSSTDGESLTNGPLLNIYATREKYFRTIPDIMLLNFIDFASKYKMVNKKLTYQPDNIIPGVFLVILDCHSAK